ncbi:MAG: 50S ribosomal protein L6 [Alphaproteobacteria bacterium]|nr:50S ribosomal protein L6 [Alphaproteobacteria bacterium]OJV16372.1 MAG: 50S ribosomal protein L6 [Alphaproteobacteria bacterium 33-17]
MSRIGKNGVKLPKDVKIEIKGNFVKVTGKLGELERVFDEEVKIVQEGDEIFALPVVELTGMPNKKQRLYRSKWGLSRTLLLNMILGVSEGFQRKLEINGVGFKAAIDKSILTLNLGYSHAIKFLIPQGIKIVAEKPTLLVVSGIDKQKVGQVSAKIRSLRKPEPYKGKGIKYEDEVILRKEVTNKK